MTPKERAKELMQKFDDSGETDLFSFKVEAMIADELARAIEEDRASRECCKVEIDRGKRTMNELGIGKLITGDAERDAIHVAVAPAIADATLRAGGRVKLRHGSNVLAIPDEYSDEAIGIVDPFLSAYVVEQGESFWIFLFPGTVTGIRHHWSHPRFDSLDKPKDEHEAWLRSFAEEWGFDFDDLIVKASSEGGDRYVVAMGRDLHSSGELGADYELFWYHLEAYLERRFSPIHRMGLRWSCSC